MTIVPEMIIAGFIAGFIGTSSGMGSGFLLVPYLYYIQKIPFLFAAGTSLFLTFINTFLGLIFFWRQGRIDVYTGIRMGIVAIPFAAVGASVAEFIPEKQLVYTFGCILFCSGIYLLLIKINVERVNPVHTYDPNIVNIQIKDTKNKIYRYKLSIKKAVIFSAFAGFFSSIAGIGGGIMLVFFMFGFLFMPFHIAAATSFLIVFFISMFSSQVYFMTGHIHTNLMYNGLLGIITGAPLGSILSHYIEGYRIVYILAGILLIGISGYVFI